MVMRTQLGAVFQSHSIDGGLTWARAQKEPDYDFSAQELRDLGLRHCTVLMGDIHTYSDFYDPVGDNWFIYAGSTEMTEVGEGNVLSERFGNKYDTVKKYIRFFPDRRVCVFRPGR